MSVVKQHVNVLSRFAVVGALLLATMVGLAGFASPRASAQDFPSRVQFLNASPDNAKVEVHINGDEKLDEFKYGDTSDWIDVDPGVMRITITADRSGFNWVIFDSTYPVSAGSDYHFIITDVLVMATQVTTQPLAAGMARAQILQASVDLPAVDIAVSGTDSVVGGLNYAQRSAEVDVKAGTYDLEVRLAGTTTVVATLPGVTLQEGMVYEFVIMGDPNSTDKPISIATMSDTVMPGTPVASPVASPEATPAA